MDILSLLLIVAAAGGGAGVAWLVTASRLHAAAAEALLFRDCVGKAEDDLKAARHEANLWRTQAENDAKTRAVAEASASQVGKIEAERDACRQSFRHRFAL